MHVCLSQDRQLCCQSACLAFSLALHPGLSKFYLFLLQALSLGQAVPSDGMLSY